MKEAEAETTTALEPNTVGTYPVMEIFSTLQGEGHHAGTPAVFVRLGGCDVGCHWCDVKESWDAAEFPMMSSDDIVKECMELAKTRFVVITGGEPSQYDLHHLVDLFHEHGYFVAMETAGTNPVPESVDWVCLSPKKFRQAVDQACKLAHELKVVVYNRHDLQWAQEQAERVTNDCILYLQPEWSKETKALELILPFLGENPNWKLSLQTHKYLNIP